jgi:hypothetical protein
MGRDERLKIFLNFVLDLAEIFTKKTKLTADYPRKVELCARISQRIRKKSESTGIS